MRIIPVKSFKVDQLDVRIFNNDLELGEYAAKVVAEKLNEAIRQKDEANMILATGASQFSFLNALKKISSIRWHKINVFHLDEYIGIEATHPASFRKYLNDRILKEVIPRNAYFLEADSDDLDKIMDNYSKLLVEKKVDVACIGIGENGHIAFNEPHDADFQDVRLVKKIKLDDVSRKQQMKEGWFKSLEEVPQYALTLTVPTIMSSKFISVAVPDARKAQAVHRSLNGAISEECPASVLRTHSNASLLLDVNSAKLLKNQ